MRKNVDVYILWPQAADNFIIETSQKLEKFNSKQHLDIQMSGYDRQQV